MKMPALWLLALCACGGTEINSGSYDRACTVDANCAPVFQGDACAPCRCSNAAVNSSQVARYESDLLNLRTRCGPIPEVACGPCLPRRGLCIGSTCSARPE